MQFVWYRKHFQWNFFIHTIDSFVVPNKLQTHSWLSRISWMEWWNGTTEWNTGMTWMTQYVTNTTLLWVVLYAHAVIMLYAHVVSSYYCTLGLYACVSVFPINSRDRPHRSPCVNYTTFWRWDWLLFTALWLHLTPPQKTGPNILNVYSFISTLMASQMLHSNEQYYWVVVDLQCSDYYEVWCYRPHWLSCHLRIWWQKWMPTESPSLQW